MIHQMYTLPQTFSPNGNLTLYIQDTPQNLMVKSRPLVLVCPGGGYGGISARESEPLALPFLTMGCHVAVLTYSVAPHRYPIQLKEAAWAMQFLRAHAQEWHIIPDKIMVLGCSAGGHLAAHLGTAWHEPWLAESVGATPEQIQPNGLILCYPVITSGEHRNIGSFEALLGENPDPALWQAMSLEHKVTEHTPPTFIWHTFDDAVVPAENALLFASALKRANVPFELHVYPHGVHGLSRCNEQTAFENGMCLQPECESWLDLVKTWLATQ